MEVEHIVNQILFVDSDPQALEALKTALEGQETGWNATFVTSGQAALNLLSNRWFDVIFTELRLQGMDGAQLLEHVKLHHPSIIRVLLAEPLEDAQLDRAISVAQRFVAKPWDMQTLVANLESVLGAWPRTDNPLVRTIVGRLASLPSSSSTYPRLVNVMAQPNATIDQISTVIASDPALSAKLLQVVNSAFFGLPFKVASVPQAVSYLGLTSLRALVLMSTVFAAADSCPTVDGFSPSRLQRHSLLCARLARTLVDRQAQPRRRLYRRAAARHRHARARRRHEQALRARAAARRAQRPPAGRGRDQLPGHQPRRGRRLPGGRLGTAGRRGQRDRAAPRHAAAGRGA